MPAAPAQNLLEDFYNLYETPSNTVREMALCISSTALAFFFAASAVLLIVNLPTVPSNKSLTPDPPSRRLGRSWTCTSPG